MKREEDEDNSGRGGHDGGGREVMVARGEMA